MTMIETAGTLQANINIFNAILARKYVLERLIFFTFRANMIVRILLLVLVLAVHEGAAGLLPKRNFPLKFSIEFFL